MTKVQKVKPFDIVLPLRENVQGVLFSFGELEVVGTVQGRTIHCSHIIKCQCDIEQEMEWSGGLHRIEQETKRYLKTMAG